MTRTTDAAALGVVSVPATGRKGEPAPAAPDTRTPDEVNRHRVAELEVERIDIESAAEGDPMKFAENLSSWKARKVKREERLVEIEGELRYRGEFGSLVDTAPRALRSYIRTARPIPRRYAKLLETATYSWEDGKGGKPMEAYTEWWKAWVKFCDAVDDPRRVDDTARNVLTKEYDALGLFGKCVFAAEAKRAGTGGARIPIPEAGIDAWLPGWLRYGATRTDNLADQP